ncbi:hypothetical protein INS49_012938 [Diaporthe citri]|uniref:uncharacterized protein n=1 Tax=Diaporthe citri TaxID=83186 RepID=UPI001C824CD8|nr:uncharacterized protein INS49_012938 [Diaporthe citri]KAG6359417.1 hypothetical protein INS49_012938 [Diaporthe citri]
MLLSLAGEGIIIAEAHYGARRHFGDIPPAMYSEGMKMNVISGPIYVVAVATVKVSVGLALLRIAGHTAYPYLVMTVMAIMGSWAFLSNFPILGLPPTGSFMMQTIMFQCSNPAMRWDSSVKGTCWPQHVVQGQGHTDATLNIATDVFFAVVIPAPLFWNLNVNRRTRVWLIAVLGLGVFACAASIIKRVYLYNLGNYSDWLWDSRNISIWHVVELNTGVVAGSLPAMRPLFRGVLGGSTWDRQHHNVYLRSSQLGTTASSGKRNT